MNNYQIFKEKEIGQIERKFLQPDRKKNDEKNRNLIVLQVFNFLPELFGNSDLAQSISIIESDFFQTVISAACAAVSRAHVGFEQ